MSQARFAFAVKFAAGFVLLYLLYAAASGGGAHRWLIEQATVRPAASLINVLAPQEAAAQRGAVLVSQRARLTVREGCDGLDALLLVAAAFLAAPLPWRARFAGLAAGLALVYALNQARLVALWFALRHDRELFALLHGFVAPAILVGAACGLFAWWISRPAARG